MLRNLNVAYSRPKVETLSSEVQQRHQTGSWAFLLARGVENLPCTGSDSKESTCNARETGFDPWVGKIPQRRRWLPTPVFWPGEFHGLYSPWGRKESDRTEQLSLSLFFFFFKRSHCKNGESYHHQIRATAPVVFHQEQLWPLGTFGRVDTFGCCSLQDGNGCCAPGIQWVESRSVAHRPPGHGSAHTFPHHVRGGTLSAACR